MRRSTMADTVSTATVMAKYLSAGGIKHLFGYPGDPNIEFLEAARVEGIEMILGRREGTVGFMAEAYGMLTGRPGVCVSTLGPGSTALVNGVANAYLDRVPMLAISGQVGTRLEPFFTHQVIDHNRLYAPITKWTSRMVPEAAATIMRKAFRVATAERPGPVHITTNGNVLSQAATDATVAMPPVSPIQLPQMFAADARTSDPVRQIEQARRSWRSPRRSDAPWWFRRCPRASFPRIMSYTPERSTWRATKSFGISWPAPI